MIKFIKALLFLGLFVSMPLARAEGCLEIMKSIFSTKYKTPFVDVPEYKLMEQVESIRKWTERFRRLKENSDPAINLKIDAEIAELDAFLMNNQWAAAHRSVLSLFNETEFSYVIIKRNQPILKELKELPSDATADQVIKVLTDIQVDKDYIELLMEEFARRGNLSSFLRGLEIETNNRLVLLGDNYQRYTRIRLNLEELLKEGNCDASCQKNITTLLERVGLENHKEISPFSRIIGNYKRPPSQDISNMVHDNPLAMLTRLKKERNAEVKTFFWNLVFQPELIDKVFVAIVNMPGINQNRVVRLFSMIYNKQARMLHFPKINSIIRSTKSIEDKFYYLKELNSAVIYDELLTTFSRRVDESASVSWKELKEYAHEHDTPFFNRMVRAQKKGTARGDISLVYKRSFVSKLATVIVAGGGISYWYFNRDKELVELDPTGTAGSIRDRVNNMRDAFNKENDFEGETEDGEEIAIMVGGEADQLLEDAAQVVERVQRDQKAGREPDSVRPWFTRVWWQLVAWFE